MNVSTILLELINGYKTYSAAILTIVTGVGAILSKNYSQGVADIMQALTVIFGGTVWLACVTPLPRSPRGFSMRPAARLNLGVSVDRSPVARRKQMGLMRYSWFDLVLYLFAVVLLIPLVMRLAQSVRDALCP